VGYCNQSVSTTCLSETACNAIKGDFCQYISTLDGSGRGNNEMCITQSGSPWGSCKHGVVTPNTLCTGSGDTSCNGALFGDFCTEGQPAKMCADTGIWCRINADCPGNSNTDICTAGTSRMMTVKHALRRAIGDYYGKVNFGFMNTYQGKGIGATNVSTEIFPYVKLQSCPVSANITETKLLTRGELENAGCFSLANGPSSSCTIDYGGNGAINTTVALNQITYALVGGNDSRWNIPRGDGSGKYYRVDASWSSCASSQILPACEFGGQGTGLYEGSYYTFSYKQGTPIAIGANGGVDGEGSRAHPKYFTTYMGKYYDDGAGNCYNAVDADRTDIVNDGIYGRVAYTGNPYNSSNEVKVPWSGSSSTSTCNATTGAIWNQNVVPFLTDTTFGGKSVTPSQKALMTAARLEKASFGGVYATGQVAPIGCALNNDGAADVYHSAAQYMSTVQTNDQANNNGNKPCWSNNIVLVVDGESNGAGDMGGGADCASTQCAYNAGTNPTLAGCTCAAITKAYGLAHSGTPVQTHVVVNAPATWSVRYPYTYAFLWNLAVAGSPNFDGTPSFGTSEEEVYKGISDKIAAAAYHFPFTTTGAVSGATTQDQTSKVLTYSSYLYDTSVNYPSWKGTVRAFDATSGVAVGWDAATVAANGHPSSWTNRKIFFSDGSGNVVQVQIGSDGSITNASALQTAGLGATNAEAASIMQWLLGKPELGNPAPLMGSTSGSTPIAVGQAASTPQNGSLAYSQATWKRPQLVYVGGDDGMLHAFYGHLGTKSWNGGGTSYQGGEEAFAFIPNDMLPVMTKLYAQGGQKLAPDSGQHIFGLASSPKVKDICIGSTCQSSLGTDWHTILVMPEGPGGNRPFALDITNVIDNTLGPQPGNLKLLWSAAPNGSGSWVKLPSGNDGTAWDQSLGQTNSVPSFYFSGFVSGAADNRVLMASGYPVKTGSGYSSQGLVIVNADAATGAVKDTQDITSLSATTCSQSRALMADVAVARYYSSTSANIVNSQSLMAAYTGDTWGNAYQYVPGAGTPLSKLYTLGCGQPFFYGPAVVQLDRSTQASSTAKNFIYLVQVTNSNLDPATSALSSSYPASQIVVTKLNGSLSPPQIVSAYNPNNTYGQIVLSLDPNAASAGTICLQSVNSSTGSPVGFNNGVKTAAQTCAASGGTAMPMTARPIGTPNVVLRSDGLGFQVITGWYDATMTNNCSSGSFNYGNSYVTVHEFAADGTWFQLAGLTLTNTVLTGVAFVGASVYVDGMTNGSVPQSIDLGETFSTMQQLLNNSALERYSRTMWTERVDL
jgi:hypothetical protein